jgi:hypothetical protein
MDMRFHWSQPCRQAMDGRAAPLLGWLPVAIFAIGCVWMGAAGLAASDDCLDLTNIVNRSFAEWSGQGPDNRLTGLAPGRLTLHGVPFEVISGSQTDGKAILVFDSPHCSTTVHDVDLPVGSRDGSGPSTLYLLHTACWVGGTDPIGSVTVHCQGGKDLEFPIRPGSEVADWWNPVDQANGLIAYQERNQSAVVGVYASRFAIPADAGRPLGIHLHGTGNAVWIVLAATLADGADRLGALAAGSGWTGSENATWKAVDSDGPDLQPGSALDLSAVFPVKEPAGAHGFVVVDRHGGLAFADAPEVPVRFLACCTVMGEWRPGLTSPAEIDAFTDQVARSGYNMLRPHYLESMLSWGYKPGVGYDSHVIDLWDRLVAALKSHGIYLFLDISSLNLPTKLAVQYDPDARKEWAARASELLTHVNPYTSLALKDDPVLAIGQLTNEAGLDYILSKGIDPAFAAPFHAWLAEHYQTFAALRSAWSAGGPPPEAVLPSAATGFDQVPFPDPYAKGPAATDVQLFFIDKERETSAWMMSVVRGLGLHVPLTNYNNGAAMETDAARDNLPLVDNHCYFDHPRFKIHPFDPDTVISGANPLLNGLLDYREMGATRQLGRPFTVSEWGQVFWNPYRHMEGLTLPPYAALQGWQMIQQFDQPVRFAHELKPQQPIATLPLSSFRIYNDPATKASEWMAALLFRRGDVRTSPHEVEIALDAPAIGRTLALKNPPAGDLTHLFFLTRFGVVIPAWAGAAPRAALKPDFVVSPQDLQRTGTSTGSGEPAAPGGGPEGALVARLHAAGVLPGGNATDVAHGVYQSDTGEITLDEHAGTVRVSTPRSQGGNTLVRGAPVLDLPNLHADIDGGDATIFAGSLTDSPLASSRRILLIVATDVLNTGMSFADDSHHRLVDLGHAPALMRVVSASVAIANHASGRARAWALSSSGRRSQELKIEERDGSLRLLIDLGHLEHGPTPYFEISRGD